jgi:ATP diphosphatase
VVAKIEEELDEVQAAATGQEQEEEIGDLLFAVVNLARHLKVDPEAALRAANSKFDTRFRMMESIAGETFASLSLDQKEALWQQAKRQEKPR